MLHLMNTRGQCGYTTKNVLIFKCDIFEMAAKVEEPELWNLNKNYFWLKFTKQTITQHYIMLCDGLFKKKSYLQTSG